MKRAALPFAFILGGSAIALVHCSSSSATSSAVNPDGGFDGAIPLGPAADHYPAGSSCRATRAVVSGGASSLDGGTCGEDAGAQCRCSSDSDCTNGTNGRCYATNSSSVGSICNYDTCFASSDCASGTTCACGDLEAASANVCVPSNCRTDDDCGNGGFCSPTLPDACNPSDTYGGAYCHTAKDECVNDSDCATDAAPRPVNEPGGFQHRCIFVKESSKWSCVEIVCGAG